MLQPSRIVTAHTDRRLLAPFRGHVAIIFRPGVPIPCPSCWDPYFRLAVGPSSLAPLPLGARFLPRGLSQEFPCHPLSLDHPQHPSHVVTHTHLLQTLFPPSLLPAKSLSLSHTHTHTHSISTSSHTPVSASTAHRLLNSPTSRHSHPPLRQAPSPSSPPQPSLANPSPPPPSFPPPAPSSQLPLTPSALPQPPFPEGPPWGGAGRLSHLRPRCPPSPGPQGN